MTSSGPAQIAGFKNKGDIKVGYDADFVLVDPNHKSTISNKPLFTKCGWSPFKGWPVRGKIISTFLRGREVYRDGKILVPAGYGRLVGLS